MNRLVRAMSEPARDFDGRVLRAVEALAPCSCDSLTLDARVVYAEGVLSGLQIALAALQRRERVIDYIARWELRHRALKDSQ